MRENNVRVPSAPGSCPSGRTPSGSAATRYDPSRAAVAGEIFAQRLRVALARANVNRPALAEHLGVSTAAVHKWTHGEAFPCSSRLVQLAQLLDCGVDWLMLPEPVQVRTEYDRPRSASAIEARRDETQGGSGEAESAVAEGQTPEQRFDSLSIRLNKIASVGDNPLTGQSVFDLQRRAVIDAIAAAERAAYGRARQVALDYWADRIADHGCPSSAGNAVMNVADAILALDKPKEST